MWHIVLESDKNYYWHNHIWLGLKTGAIAQIQKQHLILNWKIIFMPLKSIDLFLLYLEVCLFSRQSISGYELNSLCTGS